MERAPQNRSYENFPSEVKDAVLESLLREQGYLCAYTMVRIETAGECHIEHIIPQNQDRTKDLDYTNMAACFPRDGGDTSFGFGAPLKAGAHVVPNENFVSPNSGGCEGRFLFDGNGKIRAREGDAAAEQTIQTIRLDHPSLVEMRREVMAYHGLGILPKGIRPGKEEVMGPKRARRFAEEVLKPDAAGRLAELCVALAQAALRHAEREEARARRLRKKTL
jgi:uncharacterized protein (TIGR02646 family)